jgi:beta-lactamase regulating signal transducer with metallopeptidase domain
LQPLDALSTGDAAADSGDEHARGLVEDLGTLSDADLWDLLARSSSQPVDAASAAVPIAGVGPSSFWSLLQRRSWWPGIIWAGAAAFIALRRIGRGVVTHVYSNWSKPQNDAELSRRVCALARRFGLARVRDVVVPGITGPIAFGVFRPTVGLPPRFSSEFDVSQQNAMLAHELEHLAARDPIWYFLADLAAAALWWHPMVWWARRQLRTASEWAADEASLMVPNGPDVLADCLVNIGGRLLKAQHSAQLGIEGVGFRSDLGRRVTRLLSLGDQSQRRPVGFKTMGLRIFVTVVMVTTALASTGWSSGGTISEGETMRLTLQQSWHRSLAAAAVFSVFGAGNAAPAAVIHPIEALAGAVHDPEAQKKLDMEREAAVKHAQAIKEKLERVHDRIQELKEAGKFEEAEKVAHEARDLKAVLEKLSEHGKAHTIKIHKQALESDSKGDKSSGSIEALHERLKQLEAENAKLRAALAGKAAGHDDMELKHKHLKELHEKLGKAPELFKKEEADKVKMLEKERRVRLEELLAKQPDSAAIREKLERAAEEVAKLKEKGHMDKAEAVEAERRKLSEVLEKIGRVKEQDGQKSVAPHVQEMGAMLKELREEVMRLRKEVTEIRHWVNENRDAKKPL